MDDLEVPPFQETSKSILDLFCSIMGVSQDHLLQGIASTRQLRDAGMRLEDTWGFPEMGVPPVIIH